MKKPAKLHKKAIEINPYPDGGFRLTIKASKATLFTFAYHSPYWLAKCEMENMIYTHNESNKSTYKSIRIGRWRWVDSDTRKRAGNRIDKIKERDFSYKDEEQIKCVK